ncbi:MAG: hypothetical protein R3B13_21900 [Polyangiaceae bacterium]
MIEKRRNRSEISGTAAGLYLRSARQRQGLKEFVLADQSGLVIAASGTPDRAEVVASMAAMRDAGSEHDAGFDIRDEEMHLSGVTIFGQRCVLAALGPRRPDMVAAAAAMHRIFA